MLAVNIPEASVSPVFGVTVPSLACNDIDRSGMRLPSGSAAATESCHGPVVEPLYAGVAMITISAAVVGGVVTVTPVVPVSLLS
jgi:hypothetical protein